MIQTLNQLKRTLREGTQFEITRHCRPECVGQVRAITLANSQGFYSKTIGGTASSANHGNYGRGPILWWGFAAHWAFENGVCSVYDNGKEHTENRLIMAFRVLDEEEI